ncbi:HAD-IIIA family hydrolase [Marinactinospora thermotolerans]|uniref:D,D-heptose 1,7-bisphosphate phosphatase n=1 Tax=Marinactinospora thermotolerans DSM 45154 TaxID=1122192 RepID=A0A1T4K580_9ACTN|nr:HAD-IIIA family hydrolase [Marinactinospora thermotolerans]SJZ37579.1 haloacid dehalogenase superfamily, subfamily IA, variant 3 with third motif having DD or ED [Marinactinospora thermotolerans DSM 45154]
MARTDYAVVVPTVGRPGLERVLRPLLDAGDDGPLEIVVVDDRLEPADELPVAGLAGVRVLRSGGRGPAAARNVGWRAATGEWIAFLDDDVAPPADWPSRLAADLAGLPAHVAGSQGRIVVPEPVGRRPTDAERGTLALSEARWITADMAYRRSVLAEVGGFDERFPRAYREDTDLALRVIDAGYGLVRGERRCPHPLREDGHWGSLRAQRGNADNALMRRVHGPRWRERVGERPGRLRRHALTSALLAGTAFAAATGHRRSAAALGLAWGALTAEFAARRIAAGPLNPAEVTAMVVTSALIPPLACYQRAVGEVRHRRALPRSPGAPAAILFDRDGTLVHDVPYNADPALVRPVRGARAAVRRARAAGVRVGVVSNQSGVARGLISPEQLRRVNARVEALLGPFDVWRVCVHGDGDGCDCRKPRPGMIESAAAELGVEPGECVVIGDIGADVEAARAAGARGILVPNGRTRPAEVAAAPETAGTLGEAVDRALRGPAG